MREIPNVRGPWDDTRVCIEDYGPSLTRAEFALESDINTIMRNATKSGVMPTRTDMARYGDFSAAPDFMEAQNIVIRARAQFASLPSELRNRFENDPGKFLAWITDKNVSLDDVQRYGLLSEEGVKRVAERKRAAAAPPPAAT